MKAYSKDLRATFWQSLTDGSDSTSACWRTATRVWRSAR